MRRSRSHVEPSRTSPGSAATNSTRHPTKRSSGYRTRARAGPACQGSPSVVPDTNRECQIDSTPNIRAPSGSSGRYQIRRSLVVLTNREPHRSSGSGRSHTSPGPRLERDSERALTIAPVDANYGYAESGDVRIAYAVVGGGELDIIVVPGLISHLDLRQRATFSSA